MTNKANISISATQLDLFLLCRARYNYRYNLKKVKPTFEKAHGLDRGGVVHEGNEVYYSLLKEGKDFVSRVDASLLRMKTITSDPELSTLSPEDANNIFIIMEQYYTYWRFEDETWEILGVEEPFAYVLFEDEYVRILITGIIDLAVNIPAIGRNSSYTNLPIDHKTYQRDFPPNRLSNQFINYAAVLDSNYLIVNRIGFHKLDGKKPKTPEEKFKRNPLSYDPLIIAQWKENTTKIILEEYLPAIANDNWSMNFTSCYKFNRLCEYFDVCDSSGEEAKVFKLESYISSEPFDLMSKKADREQDDI